MKTKMKTERILLGLFTPLALLGVIYFLPWADLGGRYWTLPVFLRAVRDAGGLDQFYAGLFHMSPAKVNTDQGYASLVPGYYMMYLTVGILAGYFIRIIPALLGKSVRGITRLLVGAGILMMVVSVSFQGYQPWFGFFLAMVIVLADTMLWMYMRNRRALKQQKDDLDRKEAERRSEVRRRTAMPGRYDREFYRVIWKNFRYNRRSFRLFLTAGTMIASLFYSIFGVLALNRADRKAGAAYDEYYSAVTGESFQRILPVLALFSLVVMTLILTHYIRTRMSNYSVFVSLGVRMSTLRRVIGMEILFLILLTLVLGWAGGSLLLVLIQRCLLNRSRTVLLSPGLAGALALAMGVFLLFLLIAGLINYHLLQYRNIMDPTPSRAPDRIPRRFRRTGLAAGILLLLLSILMFGSSQYEESVVSAIVMILGTGLVVWFGGALLLGRAGRRSGQRKSAGVLVSMPWRYRFRTSAGFLFLLITLNALIFTTWLPRVCADRAAGPVSGLFPYDFVYMAHSDEAARLEAALNREQDVTVRSVPALRITTPQGAPWKWEYGFTNYYMTVIWPQGQHMLIPASAYRKLGGHRNGEVDRLRGEQVHIVFQQDITEPGHPLEWYLTCRNRFRIGQPLEEYDFYNRDQIFRSHEAPSAERAVLTGAFQNGRQENLVVMEDGMFRKLAAGKNGKEGPTRIFLIQTKGKAARLRVNRSLEKLAAVSHRRDSKWDSSIRRYYSRSEEIRRAGAVRAFRTTSDLALLGGLMIAACFTFFLKYGLEEQELRQQYRLLRDLGASRKFCRNLLGRRMNRQALGSMFSGAALGVPYLLVMIRIRRITGTDFSRFLRTLGAGTLAVAAIYVVIAVLIRRYYLRRIIGRE
ncbi:FtsX-like permease family protein [Eubacterium pyruvativorans]|uniref:FtsX-like permease family protein n=1 Tax=Eubacterium pyruvativorans TaxID=155865 RepID=UPI0023F5808A|nr:FtsX-like permease family protein [Eubacterium pyruvativorans]MDD7685228.1 hypothetical protein [Eubacterium pyruvativorans]